jgi:hypothetical protein
MPNMTSPGSGGLKLMQMSLKYNSGEASYETEKLNDYVYIDVKFEEPYSNTNYIVWGYGIDGYQHMAEIENKRTDGCRLLFRNTSQATANRTIKWEAIGQ